MEIAELFRAMASALARPSELPVVFFREDSAVLPDNPIHLHNFHELRFVLNPSSGRPGSAFRIERLDVVFPAVCHHRLLPGENVNSHVLTISSDRAVRFLHRTSLRGDFSSSYHPLLLEKLDSMHNTGATGPADVQELRLLLSLLYLRGDSVNHALVSSTKIDRMIQQMRDYYYRHDLAIGELAREAGYSPRFIQTVFRKAVGTTPKEYLIRIRLEEAVKFLSEDKYSIKEIASLSGFRCPHYFTNSFRKHFGCSPTAFCRRNGSSEYSGIRTK
ncbi:MAG: HTH-type transcriptional activator Btr [Lentisphaerae bacterium ADurb.Bin242]|nr:MAG: HTH-type transcriptional activator Btr [Lentisphaerae bacterium ADurb.Bin242]